MKVVMALHPIPNGVQHHRMLTPSVMLANTDGFEVKHVPDLNMCPLPLAMWADVVIVSRLITEFPEKQAKIIESLKSTNAKLVVDLDDHWILPSGHRDAKLWKDNRTAHCIRETLKHADLVWTTTEPLKTAIGNITDVPVHVVPNGISPYDTQWSELGEKRPYSELMIGVSAAPNHYPDLRRLKPALQKLRAQRGWRILAMGVHDTEKERVKAILGTDRIVFEQPRDSWDYADMYSNVDLMVAPLDHSRFNCYRSDLKLAEAAHSRTPILVENYGPYRNHICSVNTWDKLAQVVKEYLTTDPYALEKYSVNNLDDHSTIASDRIRVETLKALVQAPMQVVKTIRTSPYNGWQGS